MTIHKGNTYFALLMSYFLTWGNALSLDTISLRWGIRLVFFYLMYVIMLSVLFWGISYFTGKPMFGTWRSTFYSVKRAIPTSLFIVFLFGVLNYWGGCEITPLHIIIYVVGGVIGFVAIMLYLKTLVNKKEPKKY